MAQKKIKVLFVVTQAEFGGAQRFLLELTTRLNPAAYDVLVSSQPGELLKMLAARGIATKPLTWLSRDISPIRDILAAWELYGFLGREKPDTLFLLSSKAGFLGSLAARLHATRYTLHVPRVVYRIGGWAFNDPQPRIVRRLYLWGEKISAPWKDVIITNSRHDTEQAKRLGIAPRKKLITVYNGLDVDSLNFLPREHALKKLSISTNYELETTGHKLIGCVANFYKTKGLAYFIEAAAALRKKNPDARFVIIGDGRERQSILRGIKRLGLQNHVRLAGRIPEAWRYLKVFDVFVLPSLKEGFPWAALEIMASGVPIVATRVGALPEIIESGKNGLLVEPGNAAQITAAVETLLENNALCESLAAEARKTVEQRFTCNTMLREIENLL